MWHRDDTLDDLIQDVEIVLHDVLHSLMKCDVARKKKKTKKTAWLS